jgi:hypothetical protein
MLILKQNAANSVPTPPAGKGTIFLDDSDTLSVKTSDGNVETFPTVAASNSQVVFMNGTALSGEAAFTYDFNNNILSVSGNVAAGNVLTNNLLYANGTPWDLQQAAGANTQIQFNDDNDFGGTANLTFNKTTNLLTVGGNVNAGNVFATGDVSGATLSGSLTTSNQSNITTVGTLGSLAVTSGITAGNVYANSGTVGASVLAGTLSTAAQPNITSVGTLGSLNVSGNANVGNIGGNNALFTTVSGTLATSSQPNVTSLGTLTGLAVNGNITAANITANTGIFTGNGVGLTNIAGGNVTGTVANATHATTANTVTTAAQPNITSVGTLSSLAVTGNTTTGNLSGANLVSANFVTGTLTTAAQPNITSVGTLTGLSVDGSNITLANGVFAGNGSGLFSIAGANVTGTVANATHASTANTVVDAAQPNITSVGTLTSLAVTGNGTFGNVYANSGIIGAQTLKGDGGNISNITPANINGQVANALVAGTVYTAAQPNITSVGTLTSLAVTGNITAGNVSATDVSGTTLGGTLTTAAQPNITSVGTLSSLAVTGNVAAGNLTTTGILSVTGTGVSSIAGNLDMTSNTIINLASPTNPNDAATKQYVDDVAQGLHTHDACNAATPDTLANISGGTVTYNNGTAGVGATLTTTGSYTTIDGVTLSNGMRILVKNEANTAHNGIYDRTSSTVLTRSSDFDTPTEMAGGDFTFVSAGTLYDNTGWVMPDPVTTVGTSPVVWVQFSGAGTYTAGTGLTLTGSVFSVNASQTQVTALGTVTTGTWNSLVGSSATFAAGLSGANLASITGANVTGTVGSATTAGTVTTAAQPNITSVGTLVSLAVTGNISGANITGNHYGTLLSTGANSTAGTVTGNWTLSAGSRWNATYADLAEKYVADADYEPGTVLIFGGEHEVTKSTLVDDHRVAGVVTTNPAYVMNSECAGAHVVTLALQGRVPCKVTGPVRKGDILVSSLNGHATVNNRPTPGTIIGKALHDYHGAGVDENGTAGYGVVEIAVGRF